MAIPAQRLPATALVDVEVTATTMRFTLANAGGASAARFELTLAEDGKSARGKLRQNGTTFPVLFRRLTDDMHVGDGSRPQDPRPPLPYGQREVGFTSRDGTRLAGTLSVPLGGGLHPAVLLISGSGVQDRDGSLMGHRPFLVLSDHLTRAGIAVLRVDDRGVGGSGGDTAAASIDDKVDDALAGLAWLAAQPGVDAAHLGLIGHSEGGAIAPLAAVRATSPGVAFVVLLAAPGVSGAELSLAQTEAQLRAVGAAESLITAQRASQATLLKAQLAGASGEALRAAVTAHVDRVAAIVPAAERASYEGAARQLMIDTSVAALATKASRSFSLLDPTVALARLHVPVLAMNGSLDLQVPATENLGKIQAALARAGNLDVSAVVLPGLNHLFQPARKGLPVEYPLIDVTLDPVVLDGIREWILAHASPAR